MAFASQRTRAAPALEAIERAAWDDPSAQQTLEEIMRRIVGVIDTDGFFAGATDPDTGLCLGAGLVCTKPRATRSRRCGCVNGLVRVPEPARRSLQRLLADGYFNFS